MLRRLLSRLSNRKSTTSEGRVDRVVLERLTGHSIRNLAIYERALTHRSLLRSEKDALLRSNERLEFLGDAILGMFVAEHLFHTFPDRDEGYLTRLRAKLVSGKALAKRATNIGLGAFILTGPGTLDANGHLTGSILADAFEAVIGAIYIDLGGEAAREFVHRTVIDGVDLEHLAETKDNYKSLFLEYAQANKWPQPTYRVTSEEGPSHRKVFEVEVMLDGKCLGSGSAKSKKTAEQRAARHALDVLRSENGSDPV